jgi:DNA repair protein RecN (Recombination protein N)
VRKLGSGPKKRGAEAEGTATTPARGTMLRALRVKDFAIIDDVEVAFQEGFNVITGETGAGKTLILQALAVVLGGRADADVVRAGAAEAIVEAAFEVAGIAEIRNVLEGAGLPVEDEVVVRRVIPATGRSRSYVNGGLASVGVLANLAPLLVRVYGQHEHESLRRVETHGELLDAVAGLGLTVAEMVRRHGALEAARGAVSELEARRASAGARAELLRYQIEELTRAAVRKGEIETLAADRTRHAGAARLLGLAREVERGLYSGEGAAVDVVGRAIARLREMEGIDPDVRETTAVLESVLAQIEEAGVWTGRYADRISDDPERLATIEARLAEIGRLARKYDVPADSLPDVCGGFRTELGGLDVSDEDLTAARGRFTAAEREAAQWAGKLSVERRRVARELERRMAAELGGLGMTGAAFTVRFADVESQERRIGPRGWDHVEFYLAANPGEPARPLARVASGGELSRIILGLKTMGPGGAAGAALLFDEVDAGIGGMVAEVVGRKLKALGTRGQVICITHLPQIAAFADHHYGVFKDTVAGRTVSVVRRLERAEQIAEIARMLGGSARRQESQHHAQQMLATARTQ